MTSPCLLVAADFVRTGGMDRANFALAQYLAKRGAEVHLVGHRAAADLTSMPNVRFHAAPKPANSYYLGGPMLDLVGRRWAARIASRGGRVIVNGGNCRWGDVNWVHYVHAAYEPQVAGAALRRLKWRWSHRTFQRDERAALRQARLVIVNSDRTRRDVIEKVGVPAERVHRIYLGIDPELFSPPAPQRRAEAKARLAWDARPVVAFIGGLGDRRKGFDTVFAAWRKLASEPAWNACLAVIGSGAELPEWKARIAAAGLDDSIRFLGFRTDVPDVLAACDAFIAPARYEPYGVAVQEALSMGLPALVSQSAGVAERYPAEMRDLLIRNPEDAGDLSARLRAWLARKDHFRALTLALSERLRSHTWDDMAAQMLETIQSGTSPQAGGDTGLMRSA